MERTELRCRLRSLPSRSGRVSVWMMGTPARFARRGYALLGATPAGQPLYEATGWRSVDEWQVFPNSTPAQFSHRTAG